MKGEKKFPSIINRTFEKMNTELLFKYIEGNCNDNEKIAITIWLDSDPQNMKEYFNLRKLHDISIWQQIPKYYQNSTPKMSPYARFKTSIYFEVIKTAAILLIAFFVSHNFFQDNKLISKMAMQNVYVPAGQRSQVTLGDGTKVWLNANSTLEFPNQFYGSTREVSLDGEGYFEVTTNKAKPFIVKTEKYNIKVWGTKFNLMAYAHQGMFETSLLEGSVEVLKPDSIKGVFIKPNEKIYLSGNSLIKSPIENQNHFLWKEGIISFNNANFAEMAKELELYFDLKIIINNEKILNYRCTGKFRTKDGVDHILKVLQLSNKFSFKIDDKLNQITIF